MKNHLLLALITWFSCLSLRAEPLITFSFKPYALYPATTKPLELPARPTLLGLERSFSPFIAGIPVSYGGFITVSDLQGIVSLPRLHEKPEVTILITTRITPILMGGLTIHHWEREEGTAAALYHIQRTQDQKTKDFLWKTEALPLPKSVTIKPSTIIILADPTSITLPTGIVKTTNQPNLILPDMFVKDEIIINQRSVYLLTIKQFFGQLMPWYIKKPAMYQKHILFEKY